MVSRNSSKDLQAMECLLHNMGITQYEPNVPHMLIDIAYKYLTKIAEESKICATQLSSSNRPLELSDVKLISNLFNRSWLCNSTSREVIASVAHTKNRHHLPPIKSFAGPRLPPDRYCMQCANYALKEAEAQVITPNKLSSESNENLDFISDSDDSFESSKSSPSPTDNKIEDTNQTKPDSSSIFNVLPVKESNDSREHLETSYKELDSGEPLEDDDCDDFEEEDNFDDDFEDMNEAYGGFMASKKSNFAGTSFRFDKNLDKHSSYSFDSNAGYGNDKDRAQSLNDRYNFSSDFDDTLDMEDASTFSNHGINTQIMGQTKFNQDDDEDYDLLP